MYYRHFLLEKGLKGGPNEVIWKLHTIYICIIELFHALQAVFQQISVMVFELSLITVKLM
jgi:hypothetical protein